MGWYLNRALTTLRAEVNARWPGRDRTSDGTIGDAAHQASVSDHNPDSDGSVDAWDMDRDGVDVWAVIAAFERHESALYWIFNRQIADRRNGWRREPYYGANPHDKHVHFNTRSSHENSTKPWGIVQEEDIMATLAEVRQVVREEIAKGVWPADVIQRYTPDGKPITNPADNPRMGAGYALGHSVLEIGRARQEIAALRGVITTLADTIRAGGGNVDTAAILAGVDAILAELPPVIADAVVAEIAS